jgi:hypothetical protein
LQDLVLRCGLKFRLYCHTLNHQNLRILRGCLTENVNLFLDIGLASAENGFLRALDINDHGVSPGSLAKYPYSARPKSRINHAADGGFSPDAIDMDHMRKFPSGFVTALSFPYKTAQPHSS